MKQMFRILLSGSGALLILGAGVYFGIGFPQQFNWLGFIPFLMGYTSIVISRESKEE